MAQKFASYIDNGTDKINFVGNTYYVVGTQTKSTNAWTGDLPEGITSYSDGLTIDYFLPYAGTSAAATLNLGGLGAKPVYQGNTKNTAVTTHYPAYAVLHLTYVVNSALNSGNGCWKATAYQNSTYYISSCYVSTAASTAAKVGAISNYALRAGLLQVLLMNANTYAGAITLNVNSTGAKPIYIDGAASSSANHTLPEGLYLAYYDGTNFYFSTTGQLYTNDFKTNIINVPTSSGGTSYGPGTDGQVLKSNGTTVYWGTDNNTEVTTEIDTGSTTRGILLNHDGLTAGTNTTYFASSVSVVPSTGQLNSTIMNTGKIIVTTDSYGTEVPPSGTLGQIFFKIPQE